MGGVVFNSRQGVGHVEPCPDAPTTLSKRNYVSETSYLVCKRFLDISASFLILLATLPLNAMIYIYVRMNTSGPVIFRQTRVKQNRRGNSLGKNGQICNFYKSRDGGQKRTRVEQRKNNIFGQPFVFYKYATMYPDAKERFPECYKYDYTQGELGSLVFKIKDDPRVPPWAKWLRESSLDELPNFVNVLLGDMSLVGPRPDIPEMVKYYNKEQHRLKLSVKPGVTGIAQVNGRGHLTFQETLDCDMEYVKSRSFFLDLKILALTFLKLFKGRNGGAF